MLKLLLLFAPPLMGSPVRLRRGAAGHAKEREARGYGVGAEGVGGNFRAPNKEKNMLSRPFHRDPRFLRSPTLGHEIYPKKENPKNDFPNWEIGLANDSENRPVWHSRRSRTLFGRERMLQAYPRYNGSLQPRVLPLE